MLPKETLEIRIQDSKRVKIPKSERHNLKAGKIGTASER